MNNFNSRNRRDTLRLYAAISLTALLGSISIGVSAQEATPDDWTKVEVTARALKFMLRQSRL